jgi:hypothetical protein
MADVSPASITFDKSAKATTLPAVGPEATLISKLTVAALSGARLHRSPTRADHAYRIRRPKSGSTPKPPKIGSRRGWQLS